MQYLICKEFKPFNRNYKFEKPHLNELKRHDSQPRTDTKSDTGLLRYTENDYT